MIEMSVDSTIERRLLVNYRIDPEVVAKHLPYPLRPQLVRGHAVGGVCFIRLGDLRPAGAPSVLGLRTENVAHRFAVEWDDAIGTRAGVYVPRRDSSSWLTVMGGGRIFPGKHHLARFNVEEQNLKTSINVCSVDRQLRLAVTAVPADEIGGNLFESTGTAIEFFRNGCLGLSPQGDGFGAVRLHCDRWEATPMHLEQMTSSLFEDSTQFPQGSCQLDGALLMRNLPARWTPESFDLDARSSERADPFEFSLRVST
jgi:uncharacterized protein YqjF (DUF2071 family)